LTDCCVLLVSLCALCLYVFPCFASPF
jgi:hypothetical protein